MTKTRKPYGYWKKEENVIAEARQAMEKHDWEILPSQKELAKNGYSALLNGINRHYGGLYLFRKKLRQSNKTKPLGYWESLDNTIAEAQTAMQQHSWETLPPSDILSKHRYSSLDRAITKYHGGMSKFRITLGQISTRKPPGYWQQEENVIAEVSKVMQQHRWHTLPTQQELKKHGYSSLNNAITTYHGGLNKFREKLGYQNFEKPKGYWQSFDNAIAEAQKAMQKHNWDTLPSARELRKHRYSALNSAINKYHGGLNQFRTTLGQTNPEKPKGYWKSLDNTIAEALKSMEEHSWETLPSCHELDKNGYSALTNALKKYHGGFQTFRTKLGQQNTTKQNGYWQQEENTIAEAKKAMQKHEWNTLPSENELQKYGYYSLNSSISKYYGGILNFRKLLTEHETGKTQKQQLEELLDEYIAA